MNHVWDLAHKIKKISRGLYEVSFDENWFQGGGAYGGVVFAAFVDAFSDFNEDSSRVIRNLQVQMLSPASKSRAEIHCSELKLGKNLSFFRASLRSGSYVIAEASSLFGKAKIKDLDFSDEHGEMPSSLASDYRELREEVNLPFPSFLANFDIRLTKGGYPGFGEAKKTVGAWIKLKQYRVEWSHSLSAAMIDILWPAVMVQPGGYRAASTGSFSINFFSFDSNLSSANYVYAEKITQITEDGYSDELNILRTENARVLAKAHQSVLINR